MIKKDLLNYHSPFHSEWTGQMRLKEIEYRTQVPEGKVVDALQAWMEARGCVPAEEFTRLWCNIEQALKELEEGRLERLRIAQEHFEATFEGMNPYVSEIKSDDDKELQEIFAG